MGRYTFIVVMAPLTWPLTRDEIETIDGLSPKEAIASIIDLSAGAAKKLGFYKQGIARVLVETVNVEG